MSRASDAFLRTSHTQYYQVPNYMLVLNDRQKLYFLGLLRQASTISALHQSVYSNALMEFFMIKTQKSYVLHNFTYLEHVALQFS